MQSIKDWLLAGSPAHWVWIAGALILIAEDLIARSRLAASSTIQLVSQLLGMIPVLGPVLGILRPKVARAAVRLPLDGPPPPPPAAIVLLMAGLFCVGGCGNISTTMNKAVASTALAASSCYSLTEHYDIQKQEEIRAQAKGGHPAEAQAAFDAWKAQRAKVLHACAAAHLAALEAQAQIPVLQAAQDKKKPVNDWIARLAKLATDTWAAMREVGINPGGTP